MPGKARKKYRNAKKALDAGQGSNSLAKRESIPYPNGQTHGRGNFNLVEFLFEASNISKEDYCQDYGFHARFFTFILSNSLHFR